MKQGGMALLLLILIYFSVGVRAAWQDTPNDMPSGLPVDSRCVLSVSTPVIDYGKRSRWQLQDASAGQVSPGKRTLTLSVVCPYTQPIKLALLSDLRYGMQGHINVNLSEPELDGQRIQLASLTPDGNATTSAVDNLRLHLGSRFAAVQNDRLATGKQLTLRVDIEPLLAERDARVFVAQSNEATLTLELIK
ncbi:fimbrial protein [Serratia fonticola]|uniref:fimbrial protein n=1 Tax=Serratia fonticola TaxID=47917 RepID=UPI001646979C|nr:fimbrial protein [Serratia fonticola]MBC3252464.1 fimbrial protein [Serratia fonticola]